ncbi:hypothetical protein CIW83_18320 [Tissierella sp. P1]|uniref:hypothetical protein n=1 Tax=Tissierella sp. P1 TaxID=1280483 RepID=UPI000BA0A3F0|nr:hypothetical protein [Tissierella sp. P1]OZV10775.1 hypothetical protein CIW83_18320 [Tissierella sp. P1]
MDLKDITKELYQGSKRLEEGSQDIFLLAKAAAETERDYRVALAKEKIRLRDEKMPVGLIEDVARGNIADLRFQRDLAREKYIAARDSLKAIAVQINALQSILRIQNEV